MEVEKLSYEIDYQLAAPYPSDFCKAKSNYAGVVPSVSKNNIQTFPSPLVDLSNYMRFTAFKNVAEFKPPPEAQEGKASMTCLNSSIKGLDNARQGAATRVMNVELPGVELPMINELGRKIVYSAPGVDAKRMAMDQFERENARRYKR